jgi:hypothetical protein
MNTEYDFSAATGAARDKMQHALDTARQQAGDVVACGAQCVRERPAVSLLTAFAVGIAVGAVAAAVTRPEPKARTVTDSIGDSRARLAELFDAVAANLQGPLSKTYATVSDSASSLTDSVSRALEKIHPPKKFGWW